MNVQEHVVSLKEYGVTVIENALSDDLVEMCKNNILDYFSNKDNWCLGYNDVPQSLKSNGFNYEELKTCSEVLESQKILDVMSSFMPNFRWVYHNDVHLNFPGAKEFHSDEQVRLWPDNTIDDISVRDDEYKVYRLATYLTEPTKEDGAPFFVKPKSHTSYYTGISYPDAYEVNAKPGDVVIFHAAMRHKGGDMRQDRPAIFWAFGEDNLHSVYHSMAAVKRTMDQNFENDYKLNKHLSDILDKHNIKYELDEDLLNEYISTFDSTGILNEY